MGPPTDHASRTWIFGVGRDLHLEYNVASFWRRALALKTPKLIRPHFVNIPLPVLSYMGILHKGLLGVS